MVRYLWQSQVLTVGEFVNDYLQENKIILFAAPTPVDLAMYCVVHRPDVLFQPISPGKKLEINGRDYTVTAVGEVANKNLQALGHITLSFDSAGDAELPGNIHLQGDAPDSISPGDKIGFYET